MTSGAAPSPTAGGDAAPPVIALGAAACRAILARNRMCVLATADGDEPYAVPVYYGYDGTTLYLGISEGRKTRALDRNPRVCIVVSEPGTGDAWRSVMVTGRAVELTADDRAAGMRILAEHNRRTGYTPPAGRAAPRRPARGRVLRIDDPVITGRSRG